MGAQVDAQVEGQGIIARFDTPQHVGAVKRPGMWPAIDVLGDMKDRPFPVVHVERHRHRAHGAEHLLERGIPAKSDSSARQTNAGRTIVWTHSPTRRASTEWNGNGFTGRDLHEIPEAWDTFIEARRRVVAGAAEADWGLMLCNDGVGPMITAGVQTGGHAVPEEVAIVGVDNDEPICAICDPPLTSVDRITKKWDTRRPHCSIA